MNRLFVFALIVVFLAVGPAYAVELISDSAKTLAITSIQGYDGVREAQVYQDGKKIKLVIVVGYGTSKQYAKELGDNFVRLVKTFSKDSPPGKKIGKGIYDYHVGVATPNAKLLVQGVKIDLGSRIVW